MGLPEDIQDHFYKMLLKPIGGIIVNPHLRNKFHLYGRKAQVLTYAWAEDLIPQILAVNRKIHDEATPILYGNTFCITRFITAIPDAINSLTQVKAFFSAHHRILDSEKEFSFQRRKNLIKKIVIQNSDAAFTDPGDICDDDDDLASLRHNDEDFLLRAFQFKMIRMIECFGLHLRELTLVINRDAKAVVRHIQWETTMRNFGLVNAKPQSKAYANRQEVGMRQYFWHGYYYYGYRPECSREECIVRNNQSWLFSTSKSEYMYYEDEMCVWSDKEPEVETPVIQGIVAGEEGRRELVKDRVH